MRGEDTVTILPTGYGKSLVFELLPYIFDIREAGQIPHSIIIFSPLDVIIKDQLSRYGHKHAIESDVRNETEYHAKFLDCRYRYMIGHPENILQNNIMTVLRGEQFQRSAVCIVVDEAHCVAQCGDGFRPDFLNISKLRGILLSVGYDRHSIN